MGNVCLLNIFANKANMYASSALPMSSYLTLMIALCVSTTVIHILKMMRSNSFSKAPLLKFSVSVGTRTQVQHSCS